MAKMPEEGRFEYGKMDKQTGAQWVHVTPEMARAHPQGKLNLPLWLITGVFAAFGLLQLVEFAQFGDWLALFKAVLQLLTAIMLVMRAPISLMLAGAQLLLSVFGAVTGGMLKNMSELGETGGFVVLAYLIFCGLSLFYLFEGDRPNLIYRHRFRSFRGAKD